ncbi:GAF and ANTAR domain-containing protein [Nocardioides sp. AN3]
MTRDAEVLDAARQLSQALRPGDLDATLERITRAAVEVLPEVDYASITVKHASGHLETAAPTDEAIIKLDAAQYQLQEGPCYESATETVHVLSPHLADDVRFPRYAPVAVRAGILAQAGLRLFDTPTANGALNLYSVHEGSFEDLGTLHELFVHHAATALAYAREIGQLQEAVKTRQVIGQAVGVTMERFGLNEARAFGFLTRLSQDTNVKLRVVAERLLEETGKDQDR